MFFWLGLARFLLARGEKGFFDANVCVACMLVECVELLMVLVVDCLVGTSANPSLSMVRLELIFHPSLGVDGEGVLIADR